VKVFGGQTSGKRQFCAIPQHNLVLPAASIRFGGKNVPSCFLLQPFFLSSKQHFNRKSPPVGPTSRAHTRPLLYHCIPSTVVAAAAAAAAAVERGQQTNSEWRPAKQLIELCIAQSRGRTNERTMFLYGWLAGWSGSGDRAKKIEKSSRG
jgi:hypothetical protein